MERRVSGVIFNIARFCTSDGPGIRTTVFFKGCPLHCIWCHNPEGLSPKPQLVFEKSKCAACGACAAVCPNNCHSFSGGAHVVDFLRCAGCGACTDVCGFRALSTTGKTVTVGQVLDTVLRDEPYYRESSGGVTLSGGEVLSQPEFAAAILKALKAKGIHTCVETSGAGARAAAEEIFDLTDLVLMDYKHGDPEKLRELTGMDTERFVCNMEYLESLNKPVILRCPIIKGVNADDLHIRFVADAANRFSCVCRIELLPYHNLGCEKAAKLGLPYREFEVPDKVWLGDSADFLRRETGKNVSLV